MAKTKALDKGKTLTAAHEDYIKAIYLLRSQDEEVTNSALANHLNVSPASATNMVKKLADLNLVEYEPYQSISLTVSGERVALEVLRHHRLLGSTSTRSSSYRGTRYTPRRNGWSM